MHFSGMEVMERARCGSKQDQRTYKHLPTWNSLVSVVVALKSSQDIAGYCIDIASEY